jgi:hypothetical protein
MFHPNWGALPNHFDLPSRLTGGDLIDAHVATVHLADLLRELKTLCGYWFDRAAAWDGEPPCVDEDTYRRGTCFHLAVLKHVIGKTIERHGSTFNNVKTCLVTVNNTRMASLVWDKAWCVCSLIEPLEGVTTPFEDKAFSKLVELVRERAAMLHPTMTSWEYAQALDDLLPEFWGNPAYQEDCQSVDIDKLARFCLHLLEEFKNGEVDDPLEREFARATAERLRWGQAARPQPLPVLVPPQPEERSQEVPASIDNKALELLLHYRDSGFSKKAFAEMLGCDEGSLRPKRSPKFHKAWTAYKNANRDDLPRGFYSDEGGIEAIS